MAAVHLSFDQLELGDLTFRLPVRPRQGDRGADSGFIFGDTARERRDQARPGSHDPSREFSIDLVADHGLECGHAAPGLPRGAGRRSDRRDGDRLGFRKGVTSNRHQTSNGAGRLDTLEAVGISLFRARGRRQLHVDRDQSDSKAALVNTPELREMRSQTMLFVFGLQERTAFPNFAAHCQIGSSW